MWNTFKCLGFEEESLVCNDFSLDPKYICLLITIQQCVVNAPRRIKLMYIYYLLNN